MRGLAIWFLEFYSFAFDFRRVSSDNLDIMFYYIIILIVSIYGLIY